MNHKQLFLQRHLDTIKKGCTKMMYTYIHTYMYTKNVSNDLKIFTDSALWAGSFIESPCPSVCVSVCAIAKHPNPEVVETCDQRRYS